MSTAKVTLERQRQRARQDVRREALIAAGAPVGAKERSGTTGLGYIADQLQPRTWEEVNGIAERVGYLEALIASGSVHANGLTMQLQVLPDFAHTALDLVQRSNQGVILFVAFQVPWSAFIRPHEDDPDNPGAWDTDEFGERDGTDP